MSDITGMVGDLAQVIMDSSTVDDLQKYIDEFKEAADSCVKMMEEHLVELQESEDCEEEEDDTE